MDCLSRAENMFLLLSDFLCGQASSGAGGMAHKQEVLWPDLCVKALSQQSGVVGRICMAFLCGRQHLGGMGCFASSAVFVLVSFVRF